ncbi:ATP-binding protein [Piscinibacter sp. HJYY11]|uniref:ATP-binding protein n=1 Tax=Piscinibacter sp. HJYY11 TaxID=2801333 RepID=UPI00191F5CDD|nr:ATP-binding protein [Piscinibacter sp. HJYY11]MBL0730210.1 response regulator [Piscinibacter sp. HJYY11]
MRKDPHQASNSPAARPGTPNITLVARGTALWLFILIAASVLLVWWTETALGQIAHQDRYAYPLIIVCLLGLAALVHWRGRYLVLAQGLGSLMLSLYFIGSVSYMLLVAQNFNTYAAASMSYWLVGVHLLVYATWPLWRALFLCLTVLTLTSLPAVVVHLRDGNPPEWNNTIWPLVVNGFFAQLFVIGALFGIARQLRKLSVLAPPVDSNVDDPTSQPLTVDDVVTRRMRDLESARDQAEQASQAKSRFLAVMSHELRTPLHGVLGAADLLRDPSLAEPNRRELVETVRRGGTHLLHLINDVLDLSRIEAGRLELLNEPFELRACIGRVLETIEPQASAKSLQCRVAVEDSVPAWLRGDEFRLKQILINLLGNAVKFTDTGHVSLALRYEPIVKQVHIHIEDTGIGIERSHQPLVFDAFHQADSGDTRRHAGSGLGLAITRQLVGLMHGTLALQSEPGIGTRVTLRLPLPPTETPNLPPVVNSALAPLSGGLAGLRVLLVDDDAVNTMIATQMLETASIEVHTASSGVEALNQLTRGGFDLVLMDWRMPDMDGLEATRRLRAGEAGEAARQLPVVGLTANAYAEDRAACLEAGMDEVLVKPVGRMRLLQTVQQALEARAAAAHH